MDPLTFWIVLFFAAVTFYRLWYRAVATPKGRVAAMLRRYHALEKSGLTEQECLLRLLETRRGWKKLAPRFLLELVCRLRSKEDLFRFVSVSEEYGYLRERYPALATKTDLETAMIEVACLFAEFGHRLQGEGRLKEAEFVQKLALRLQPHQYFTNLPLAATYHEMGRDGDALPLFEKGLAHFKKCNENNANPDSLLSPARCLGADAEIGKLQKCYRKMYAQCRKAVESSSASGICILIFAELLC
jgi:hypothetical protein